MNRNIFIMKYLNIILLSLQLSFNFLQAIPSLDFGEMFVPPAGIVGTGFDSNFAAYQAFDGINNSPSTGWRGLRSQTVNLRWNLQQSAEFDHFP